MKYLQNLKDITREKWFLGRDKEKYKRNEKYHMASKLRSGGKCDCCGSCRCIYSMEAIWGSGGPRKYNKKDVYNWMGRICVW